MKRIYYFATLLIAVTLIMSSCSTGTKLNTLSKQDKQDEFVLLFDGETVDGWKGYQRDDFPTNWVVEEGSNVTVKIKNGKLEIDNANGSTVWFKKELEEPVLIEYEAKLIKEDGTHGQVSDLNCFWMATDPKHPENIFHDKNRRGKFKNYHPLCLYYVGYGANNNTTTRFRRYPGGGERPCLPGHDLRDDVFMLIPNKWIKIQIVVNGNKTQYFLDGRLIFNFLDKKPLRKGWFGFRTVSNHLLIDNFKVYRLPKLTKLKK